MITSDNMPIDYKPYQKITICSNEVIGGGHLFAMGKVLPLLIGMGTKPLIWLQAVAEPNSSNFVTIVDASIATHPAVRVSEQEQKIIVNIGGINVLTVEAKSISEAIVTELDFRPLGMNIYGNNTTLYVGGMQISSSTFNGVGTAFGFGM